MPISASPDDAGDGTLYAQPEELLTALEHYEESETWVEPERRAGESRIAKQLKARMVEADDAPKIDARDWPAAVGFYEQIVEHTEALHVPKNRLRQLRFSDGRIIYEVWTPVPRALGAHEIHLAANGALPVGSWRLTYHAYSPTWCTCPKARLHAHPQGLFHADCGRLKKPKVEGDMRDHVLSLQMQVDEDAIYNGYYPTLPGDDIAHFDERQKGTMGAHQGGDAIRLYNPEPGGDPYLRGGTEIRGGRSEHRRRTKDMVELGPGAQKDLDRAAAEKKAKQKAASRLKIEKVIQKGPRQIGEL